MRIHKTKDRINYRDIADAMTLAGFVMNHSSARNYIYRSMRSLVGKLNMKCGWGLTEARVDELALLPDFQSVMCEILREIFDGEEEVKS